jgi:ABC-type branched-subunit amino acid transport system permease subunit
MDIFNLAFWSFIATIGGIYAIFALGLYAQFSLAGLPNFGHVAFMAVSSYAMAILVIRYSTPLPIGVAGGLVAAVLLGLAIGIPSLRLRSDYLAIATVACGEIIRYLAMNFPELTGGPIGSIGLLGPGDIAMYATGWQSAITDLTRKTEIMLGFAIGRDSFTAVLIWLLVLTLIWAFWFVESSPWGRVMKAIREDEVAATAVGKNVFFYKVQALTIGAVLGGGSGILLALQIGVFSPDDFLPDITFYAYLILILGGMNRVWAIPVGAILFSLLYSGTRFLNFYPLSLFDSGSRAFLRLFLVGLMLVLFMALRPQGILGNKKELLLEK